ncbi:hypothetical protein [Arthrobacter sp. NPDC057259]|uniref:hypothetical protein n=1 Tax=Arthrobacter sp. NPDC057259 TaxID=3346073 RepID=UPI0036351CFC
MCERAAYLLSESLGWSFVPPTVIREDAPLGVGSLQWFVRCDFQKHYFTLFEDAPESHTELARIALFDFVATNTDRKSGHVLRGDDGRIFGHRPRAVLLSSLQAPHRDLGFRR